MNNPPKRAIILGSGASVRQDMWGVPIKEAPLWNHLVNEYTVGLNFSYRYFESTFQMFVDYNFYITWKYDLDRLPLLVGMDSSHIGKKKDTHGKLICEKGDNLFLLPRAEKQQYWGKECWTKGFYKAYLCGLFAITFLEALGVKEIYLLGYDGKATKGKTHFYQDDPSVGFVIKDGKKETGVGFKKQNGKRVYNTGVYSNSDLSKQFEVYDQNKIKIINVNPNSAITAFPTIGYKEFYNILKEDPQPRLQSRARTWTENLLIERLKDD